MARIETMTVHNVRVTVPDEIIRKWCHEPSLDEIITPADVYKTVAMIGEIDFCIRVEEWFRQRRRSRITALRSSVAVLP